MFISVFVYVFVYVFILVVLFSLTPLEVSCFFASFSHLLHSLLLNILYLLFPTRLKGFADFRAEVGGVSIRKDNLVEVGCLYVVQQSEWVT